MLLDPETAKTLGRWIFGTIFVVGFVTLGFMVAGIIRWMRRPGTGRQQRIIGASILGLLMLGCPSLAGLTVWQSWTIPELRAELGTRHWDNSVPVGALAYHPNGQILAAGTDDGAVSLWDTANGRLLRTLSSDLRPLASIAFSADGTLVVAAGQTGVRVWQTSDGAAIPIADGPTYAVIAAFMAEGHSLLALDGIDKLHTWQFVDGNYRQRSEITLHTTSSERLRATAFSPDRATLATCRADGEVQLHATDDGRVLQRLQIDAVPRDERCALAFSPDGILLAVAAAHSGWLWRSKDGVLQRQWTTWHARYQGLAFSPDGRTLAEGVNQGATMRGIHDGQPTQSVGWHAGGWTGEYWVPVSTLAFSPDGRTLASGSRDGVVRLWHARRPIR